MVDNTISFVWNAITFISGFEFPETASLINPLEKLVSKSLRTKIASGFAASIFDNAISDLVTDTLSNGFHIRNGGYISYYIEYRIDYKFLFFIPISHYYMYEIR